MDAEKYLIENHFFNDEVKRVNGVIGLKTTISQLMEQYHQSQCPHDWEKASDGLFQYRECSRCGKLERWEGLTRMWL